MSYRTAAKHSTERVCALQPKWERLHSESERKKFCVSQVSELSSYHLYVLGSRPLSDHVFGFTPHDHIILVLLSRQALLLMSSIFRSSCSSPTLSPSSNLVFRVVVVSRLRSRILSFIPITSTISRPTITSFWFHLHCRALLSTSTISTSCSPTLSPRSNLVSRSSCIHAVMYPRTSCRSSASCHHCYRSSLPSQVINVTSHHDTHHVKARRSLHLERDLLS
jgi:hypothetical protein